SKGLIYVSAARPSGPAALAPGASGALAVLDLVALPGAKPGARSLNLLDSVYAGGENRASRLEDGRLVPGPAPTHRAADPAGGAAGPVDGSVVVTGRTPPGVAVASPSAGLAPVPGVVVAVLESVWPALTTAPAALAATPVRRARSIRWQVGAATPRPVNVQTNA